MKTKFLLGITALLALPLVVTAHCGSCGAGDAGHSHKAEKKGGDYGKAMKDKMSEKADIVDTAIAAGQFDTLIAAIKAADLVETLKSEGPFTVFAPTNAAFDKLPDGTLESLLKPENKEKLVSILTYHVVPKKLKSKHVESTEVATVNGATATIEVTDSGVSIEGANVIKTDIYASNGVIHVIDEVILPPM